MAETSGPFDPVDPLNPVAPGEILAEADWELMLQHLVDGVIGTIGSTGLRATPSGATARGVDLGPGKALARARWYDNSAVKTLTSAPNNTSVSRVDRAVLRLDRTANKVTAELLTGNPGGGYPALADTAAVTERPLWRWTVEPSATAATGLVDERQWLGSVLRPSTSASRPINPRVGEVTFDVDSGKWLGWTGLAWVQLGPPDPPVETEVPLALATKWPAASGINKVRRIGTLVEVNINVQRAVDAWNDATPEGTPLATIPEPYRPTGYHRWGTAAITPGNFARLRVLTDGGIWIDNSLGRVDVGRVLRSTFTYLI